jgi:selenocysteine lyase/cysteine desulfurase
LLEDLKIDPQQGVVRVSLVHYNTEEEVEALITALNDVLLG